jgi:hypothetical protein
MAAMSFLLADADFSNDLSEEELANSPSSRASRLGFEEFPIAFKPFVEAYVESLAESQKSRPSTRTSRGS